MFLASSKQMENTILMDRIRTEVPGAQAPDTVSGCFRQLFLFDVADAIDLDAVKTILGTSDARQDLMPAPASPCIEFERAPVVEDLAPLPLQDGRTWSARVKYYECGVASLGLESPFQFRWSEPATAPGWTSDDNFDRQAAEMIRGCLNRVYGALRKPYTNALREEYAVVELWPPRLQSGEPVSARELIEAHGAQIAQMIRGECAALSEEEAAHILQSRMSYYPTDLVVAGWAAAVVYDTPSGAESTLEILEQANIQLLELRHYDEVLTSLLSDVYRSLEERSGFLARWRLAREADRLGTMRLDVQELTERIDNSNKFLSDSYSARLYRMVAARLGVPDYRKLVDDKLRIAADLHRFMMDRFHQGSAFVLELMIVIILIIDLVYLFWPRT